MIWSTSQYFGVGKARSRSGKIIVVATYKPIGNISGHFQRNVSPPFPESGNVTLPPSQNSDDNSMESNVSIISSDSLLHSLKNSSVY